MFKVAQQEVIVLLNKIGKVQEMPAYYSHNNLFKIEEKLKNEWSGKKDKEVLTQLMDEYDELFNKAKLMSYQLDRFPEYEEIMKYLET